MLDFSDSREIARKKLDKFEATRHSYISNTWDVGVYRLNVQYTEQGSIDRLACFQLVAKLSYNNTLTHPTIEQIVSCFGCNSTELKLIQLWGMEQFDLEQEAEIQENRGLNLRDSYSVYIYFSGTSSHSALLKGVTFYAPKEQNSIGWYGELPFDDDFTTLISKVSPSPINGDDDVMTSQFVWNFPQYILHILYSNISNRILHVSLIQRCSRGWM